MGSEQKTLKDDTYHMLTRIHNWPEFSNSVAGPGTSESLTKSLEAIHNDIHFYIGGDYGHMSELSLAGEYPPTQ